MWLSVSMQLPSSRIYSLMTLSCYLIWYFPPFLSVHTVDLTNVALTNVRAIVPPDCIITITGYTGPETISGEVSCSKSSPQIQSGVGLWWLPYLLSRKMKLLGSPLVTFHCSIHILYMQFTMQPLNNKQFFGSLQIQEQLHCISKASVHYRNLSVQVSQCASFTQLYTIEVRGLQILSL